ncbi:MAG TPA: LD-carboxypeptidase [Chthonomonas sp.]|jgi:muramoyltetrapeptide carboxypeptidase|uniref:S66 peptidase family protein n=1 Tax=Chthonomonas sp. TaxID=2282153 RepID=UPI002B4B681D|nr:LD-carboxypeptidase [Chthonomonas sp.]HLH80164.1 LD-carboxypeptidase [Chthonomonas sp.]
MRPPPRLRAGDQIGIIAPSGPVPSEELFQAKSFIEQRGYKVVLGDHVLVQHPTNNYLAGTDEERFSDLQSFLRRPEIAAIFCARGGYGVQRLYPKLTPELFDGPPKIVTGYSDITALHLAISHYTDWITFYSPNATSLIRLDGAKSEVALNCFWKMLEEPQPFGTLPASPQTIETLVGGVSEGPLAGGCLSLLAHACGSRFQPDFCGKLVLIEDVNEPVYRVDRYLTQLLNAGILQEAAGFIVGTVTGWRKHEQEDSSNQLYSLWEDLLLPLGKPTIVGFPFGHEPNPLTLPLGTRAQLDADAKTLTILEPSVV